MTQGSPEPRPRADGVTATTRARIEAMTFTDAFFYLENPAALRSDFPEGYLAADRYADDLVELAERAGHPGLAEHLRRMALRGHSVTPVSTGVLADRLVGHFDRVRQGLGGDDPRIAIARPTRGDL